MQRINLRTFGFLTSTISSFFFVTSAQAQTSVLMSNPPTATLQAQDVFGNVIANQARALQAIPGGLQPGMPRPARIITWNTDIDYSTGGKIFNPRNPVGQKYDNVRLRSYQGTDTNPDVPFVAPTVTMRPGDTFRITLNNKLPAEGPECLESTTPNIPHCFNSTNLHSHGFWVSPTGNSDNVLITIRPNVEFTYEYNLPDAHPAGTFWYHPHLHGSIALQVSSGMAGAMIVEGDRLPGPNSPGDIDVLLANPTGPKLPEQLVLFQQIPYACYTIPGDYSSPIKVDENGLWKCDPGDVGVIETYKEVFGPGKWRASGRYTSINGEVLPILTGFQSGTLSRWRMIHAGARDSIKPSFVKMPTAVEAEVSSAEFLNRSPEEQAAFMELNCSGAKATQLSMATDGITRDRMVVQDETLLHPGYREDLVMIFPERGIYCMMDGAIEANEGAGAIKKSVNLLGFVVVGEGEAMGDETVVDRARSILEKNAGTLNIDPVTEAKIINDLQNNLGLAAFEPHKTMMDTFTDGNQTLGFKIARNEIDTDVFDFMIGDLDADGNILNPAPYKAGHTDRFLTLGTTDEWELKSFSGGHPFHIHVNPFQIIAVYDAEGNDVSGYDEGNETPYARLKGAWKDTIFVTQDNDGGHYRIITRTRYQRYIGDFVLHCHILDHEDQGMMQNIRITLPDGMGGQIKASHH